MGNEPYIIKMEAPLLRPGSSITTTVSEKYVESTYISLMKKVRNINIELNKTPDTKEMLKENLLEKESKIITMKKRK